MCLIAVIIFFDQLQIEGVPSFLDAVTSDYGMAGLAFLSGIAGTIMQSYGEDSGEQKSEQGGEGKAAEAGAKKRSDKVRRRGKKSGDKVRRTEGEAGPELLFVQENTFAKEVR